MLGHSWIQYLYYGIYEPPKPVSDLRIPRPAKAALATRIFLLLARLLELEQLEKDAARELKWDWK
ncbi:hypothetical protein VTJ49DRAFT_4526 [Mycothermus thermophilus]|uniref:Uncharacterized protein n=1 Tax=Humicola insolens TaxID=85995 RepID=A0ABR3V546_HUMIN